MNVFLETWYGVGLKVNVRSYKSCTSLRVYLTYLNIQGAGAAVCGLNHSQQCQYQTWALVWVLLIQLLIQLLEFPPLIWKPCKKLLTAEFHQTQFILFVCVSVCAYLSVSLSLWFSNKYNECLIKDSAYSSHGKPKHQCTPIGCVRIYFKPHSALHQLH